MSSLYSTSAEEIAQKTGSPAGLASIDGNSIYYEVAGEGPPIVFLHDGLLHRAGWDRQFEYFAQDFTVIRYDRPGYGDSEPPVVAYSHVASLRRLYEFLGIDKATLIGGSAGGRMAVDFTLANPFLATGLVLVGAPVSGFDFTEHMLNRGWVTPWPNTLEEAVDFWADDPWLIAPDNHAARQRVRDLLTAYPQNLEFYDIPVLDDGQAIGRLSEIEVPTFIVIGEADIADNHAHSGVLRAGIKGAETEIVTGAGHLPYLEQPERFNRLVTEFLDRNGLLHPRNRREN